jgi:hypothetical protein
MADIGGVKSFLGGLEADTKKALEGAFTYVLNNLRVGLPGHQKRGDNLQWIQLDGVTSSVANQEFSIAHGFAFPCLDLTSSGTQLVNVTNARVADNRRVYLRSASTSAAFTIFIEARG